ncbi:hypothetical protein HHK36_003620 [Tetracentron sinense]|uniref:DUF641 domain-containing protein n=1 Tax=Tetracentron sinense TaxID=13715 RepID=A0A834ZY42_TETSI|nr:hypothetical protein HHK36_003620 [Tetracentron sinense]
MDSVKPVVNSNRGRLARTFANVLHFRAATGIVPDDGIRKVKNLEKIRDGDSVTGHQSECFDDEKLRNRASMEALLAKLFASISSFKAAYAELQIAQSPYDVDGIQSADEMVVSELKSLSELKQSYLKKQIDPSPQVTLLYAEMQEQQCLLKTFEIMGKNLESQIKLKDSEITFLREKLKELDKQKKGFEKRLNPSGSLSILDNLYLSGLNPNHFITVLKCTVKSVQSFVKSIMGGMKSTGWDLDAAASSIQPGVIYRKANHKCFAFESFVCREMFNGFNFPKFSLPNESLPEKKQIRRHFFGKFTEMKSVKPEELLSQSPNSTFGKFCRTKYMNLVHPKMESSFFGNLNQRNLVNSGGYPETTFFASFAEMAKWVWLLHCLAFSFEPEASIFQVKKNCRYSEVYMESVAEEAFLALDGSPETIPPVGFTVMPGFKIGKTVIQSAAVLEPSGPPPVKGSREAMVCNFGGIWTVLVATANVVCGDANALAHKLAKKALKGCRNFQSLVGSEPSCNYPFDLGILSPRLV